MSTLTVRRRAAAAIITVGAGLAFVALPASAGVAAQSAGCPLLICWPPTAAAPTEPDIEARPDDVWTSECDGDICQSVPGFKDPGPGAPGGPFGPRW